MSSTPRSRDAFAGADHCDDPENLAQINAKFEGVYFPKGAWIRARRAPDGRRADGEEQLYPCFRQTYAAQEGAQFGAPVMRELERMMTLRVVDEYWMDNIDAMEDLRQGHPPARLCADRPRVSNTSVRASRCSKP